MTSEEEEDAIVVADKDKGTTGEKEDEFGALMIV